MARNMAWGQRTCPEEVISEGYICFGQLAILSCAVPSVEQCSATAKAAYEQLFCANHAVMLDDV